MKKTKTSIVVALLFVLTVNQSLGQHITEVGTASSSSDTELRIWGLSGTYNQVGGKILFRNSHDLTGEYEAAKIQWLRDKTTNWGTALSFYTNPNNSSLAEAFRIDQSQRIGVGTTNPSMKMHIRTAVDEIDGLNLTVDGTNDDGGVGIFLWNASGGSGGIIALDEKDHNGLAPNALNMYSNWSPITFNTSPNSSENYERMRILTNGNVGIGTINPDTKLAVKGTIHSEEVKVDLNVPAPDYVFEPDYELRTLQETKEYISEYKHLPEIPSAKEMETNGVELGDMNIRLLKKIEELTLYQIELLEEVEALKEKVEKLEKN